jgi:hypothetical protein
MESGNNEIKETNTNEEFLLIIEKNILFGNQKSSENKELLIKDKITHLLLIGNELEELFREVKFNKKL